MRESAIAGGHGAPGEGAYPAHLAHITLDDLLGRVRESDDGCLLWAGNCYHGGQPKWQVGGEVSARRVVYQLAHGPIPPGWQVSVRCGNVACLHPDHLFARPRAGLKLPARALAHRLALSRSKRASSRLSDAAVLEIQGSDEPAPVLAQRHKISLGYVYCLRAGTRRGAMASVWAGLVGGVRA